MGFSPLTDVILPTNKHSSRQGRAVSRAIIHNWAGTRGGIERLVYSPDQASSNYIILSLPYTMPRAGKKLNGAVVPAGTVLPAGTIIGSVDENYRAWTSGSWEADAGSITFEIQNSEVGPSGNVSQAGWNSTVRLLAEIAKRRKWGLLKFGTTVRGHREFQNTSCPGNYLWPRMGQLAAQAQAVRDGAAIGSPAVTIPPAPKNYNPRGFNSVYVKQVQQLLIDNGYSVGKSGVDGVLGKDTYNAVIAFQKDRKLKEIDGIPGPETLAALKKPAPQPTTERLNVNMLPTLRAGALGINVKRLQGLLLANGYSVGKYGVDGSWGADTSKAFKAFQTKYPETGTNGKPDGSCGPKSWNKLLGI